MITGIEYLLNTRYGIKTRTETDEYRLFSDIFNDVKVVYDSLKDESEKKELANTFLGRQRTWIQKKLYEELDTK